MSPIRGRIRTISPSYTKSYKWTITDFILDTIEAKLQSPLFSMDYLGLKYTWQIYLYPNGKHVEDEGYMSIYLYNRSNETFVVAVSFSLLNSKNAVVASCEIDENEVPRNQGCGLHKFAKVSSIMNDVIANNNTLVIHCEIAFNDEQNNEKVRRNELRTRMEELRLCEFDMQKKMMYAGKFCDVTFIIKGLTTNSLKLHRCILAKSSVVFTEMFESNPEQHTIEIKEMRFDVFHQVAWFAYTGTIQNMNEIPEDLLAAANTYKMDGLKLLCETALCDKLSVNNVFESLRIADIHNSDTLKTMAIEFIASNGEDVIDKPEFQMLPAHHLRSICEALIFNRNTYSNF